MWANPNIQGCTINLTYGQESESVEIGFLWGPKHEQFSNAFLSALNLKKHFETWNEVL